MKANAIIRIVIWSIVIVLLAGILFGVIFERSANEVLPSIEQPAQAPLYGTVTADTQVYSSPSTNSKRIALLSSGDEVEISRQEKLNSESWTLITAPFSGWVLTDSIQLEQSGLTVSPVASDESGSTGVVDSRKIKNLEIEWAAGSVTILPGTQTDTIRFWDDYSGDEEYLLYYITQGDTLKIQFCKGDWEDLSFGIHFGVPLEKNLTVEVPESWLCNSLEIDAASAKLEVHDLTINEVEIDSVSGAIGFENCSVVNLDVDTVSGDVICTGSLVTLDCDSGSASIVMYLTNIPKSLDLDIASGNLDIVLPENAGFTAKLDTMSGKFQSDFEYEITSNRYICGNGSCTITVNTMSGNVNIRKNPNETSSEEMTP